MRGCQLVCRVFVHWAVVCALRAAREIEEAGGEAKAYAVDVTNIELVNSTAMRVRVEVGPVDILINNVRLDTLLHRRLTVPPPPAAAPSVPPRQFTYCLRGCVFGSGGNGVWQEHADKLVRWSGLPPALFGLVACAPACGHLPTPGAHPPICYLRAVCSAHAPLLCTLLRLLVLTGRYEAITKTFQVNTLSHFWMAKAFLPDMVDRNHGHIVTICSASAFTGVSAGGGWERGGCLASCLLTCCSWRPIVAARRRLRVSCRLRGWRTTQRPSGQVALGGRAVAGWPGRRVRCVGSVSLYFCICVSCTQVWLRCCSDTTASPPSPSRLHFHNWRDSAACVHRAACLRSRTPPVGVRPVFGFNESLRMELKKDGKDGVKTTCVVRRRWGGSQCEADVTLVVSHCDCRCACLVLMLHSSPLRDGDCVVPIRDDLHCSPFYCVWLGARELWIVCCVHQGVVVSRDVWRQCPYFINTGMFDGVKTRYVWLCVSLLDLTRVRVALRRHLVSASSGAASRSFCPSLTRSTSPPASSRASSGTLR